MIGSFNEREFLTGTVTVEVDDNERVTISAQDRHGRRVMLRVYHVMDYGVGETALSRCVRHASVVARKLNAE